MPPYHSIEGTGQEIAEFAQQHPLERFRLIQLADNQPKRYGPGSAGWEQMMQLRDALENVMPALPLEATSTEALYD